MMSIAIRALNEFSKKMKKKQQNLVLNRISENMLKIKILYLIIRVLVNFIKS
jgi:hypothetical protein